MLDVPNVVGDGVCSAGKRIRARELKSSRRERKERRENDVH